MAPWAGGHSQYFKRLLESVAEELGADVGAPWAKLTKKHQQAFLYGTGVGKVQVRYKNRYGRTRAYTASFERSEEHTSELQSLMRISYDAFCLQKKKTTTGVQ